MADSSKTEKPTEHRRKKAREEGQVVRSREFGNLAALLAALVVLSFETRGMGEHWVRFYDSLLASAIKGDLDAGGPVLFWTAVVILRWIGPALLAAVVCSVGASFAQGGFSIAPGSIALQFDRLNPGARLG